MLFPLPDAPPPPPPSVWLGRQSPTLRGALETLFRKPPLAPDWHSCTQAPCDHSSYVTVLLLPGHSGDSLSRDWAWGLLCLQCPAWHPAHSRCSTSMCQSPGHTLCRDPIPFPLLQACTCLCSSQQPGKQGSAQPLELWRPGAGWGDPLYAGPQMGSGAEKRGFSAGWSPARVPKSRVDTGHPSLGSCTTSPSWGQHLVCNPMSPFPSNLETLSGSSTPQVRDAHS